LMIHLSRWYARRFVLNSLWQLCASQHFLLCCSCLCYPHLLLLLFLHCIFFPLSLHNQ
jgi:hypothetical protein